jgi:hypothetical protein
MSFHIKRYANQRVFMFYAIFLVLSSFLLTSCTDKFDEYNTHPVLPTPNDMTAAERVGALFPGMLNLMHNAQENDNQMIEQMVGNQYGGYMATTNNWQGTNFGTFNPPANWVDYPFTKLFSGFYANYFKVREATEGRGYIYAWANIIRVAVMLRVTDTYGPIPYTRMGEGKLAVPYDDVQTVYHSMIADLTNSVATLTAFVSENGAKADLMAEYDYVYGGDFSKWIKFANSCKLRMAVRIAHVDTDYAKQAMAEAIAGGMIETNADNAFLPTVDNPYHKAANDWNDLGANAVFSAYLSGWNDPRGSVYMTESKFGFGSLGVRTGIANINKGLYGEMGLFSKPKFEANTPLLVFCAAETQFLKAEAALKAWIPGGETQAGIFYEQGINLSMEQHKVTAGNYIAGTTEPKRYSDPVSGVSAPAFARINVSWNDTGSNGVNSRLEKIITQKWLANYPLGFEAWADYRRTNYPQLFPSVANLSNSGSPLGSIDNTKNRLIRRLTYPTSEYSGNRENVTHAVATMLEGKPDAGSTDLWWAKKP